MDFAGDPKRFFAASGTGQGGGAKHFMLLAAEVAEPF